MSVVIPALDEERNLPDALASVGWAGQVIVVDSGSTDRTPEVAQSAGAEVVQFHQAPGGPKKKQWALRNLDFRYEWVLLLDADERVPPALREEIEGVLRDGDHAGYCVDREFVFMGRSLRCFRPNWLPRLVRYRQARMEELGLEHVPGTGDNEVHEHPVVDGSLGFLHAPLLHNDYRGLAAWIERHNRYSTWEAHLYRNLRQEPIGVGPLEFLRLDPFRRRRALRRLWVRVPSALRPPLRFFVWYAFRRGFLDGREGFVFCCLMGYHELSIGVKLRELEAEARP